MSGLEIPLIIGALAGTATKVAGDVMSSSAQADQAKRSAALKEIQANEVMSRLALNLEDAQQQAKQFETLGAATIGATGASSTASIGLAVDTELALRKQMAALTREAEFNAFTLRQEAGAQRSSASDIRNAGGLQAFGTILGGLTTTGSILSLKAKGPPQRLSQTSPRGK